MKLCIEVTDGGAASEVLHRWTCGIEARGSTSGSELSRLLTRSAQRVGIATGPEWRWWTATGEDLAHLSHPGSALCAGDIVTLAAAPPGRLDEAVVIRSLEGPGVTLACGVYVIGGSTDDDVTMDGLPPAAAVIEVHRSGAVDVRRRSDVDGGDSDVFFGSPTEGRAIRFTSEQCLRGEARFALAGVDFEVVVSSRSGDQGRRRGAVNRTPYRPVQEGRRDLDEMPAPPSQPRASRMAITSFVVPLASGVGMAVLLGRIQFLLIVLLAPIALGIVHVAQRRSGRRTFAADRVEYRALLADRAATARREAERARVDAHSALPSPQRCHDIAVEGQPTLWQRAAGGPHLLRVRIGVADRPPVVRVPLASGGDDSLRAEAERSLAFASLAPGPVPADVDLDADCVIGICAPIEVATGLARSVIGQIATHHGPEDVVVAAVLAPRSLAALDGLAWLPHTRSEASPLRVPPVAVWADDAERLVAGLVEVAARRGAAVAGRGGEAVPRVVVVVDQGAPIDRGNLGRLLDLAPGTGVRVIWFGDDPTLVPRQCRSTVRFDSQGACIESTDPDKAPEACVAELLDREHFSGMARALAPCHDAASPSRSGALPATLSLAELMGEPVNDTGVLEAWSHSDGTSLAAPIGVSGSGQLSLDLVAHGPHALVAGTSGSGKSELLQTWVAATAAAHPPERCTFLFVDYKGGATAAPFLALPHVVGSVTNLDPALANRALVSLRSELDRRMSLLAGRAKDLAEFIRVAPDECPPRLVIVVDEFATLIKEVPDFLAGVVDVAQRGRSLGIHLILATQRPAGSVNDDILANTTIRVALRVVDSADSRSVIGTDDAAGLASTRAGRAFVRLGPGAITGVQVARSTAAVLAPGHARSTVERAAITAAPLAIPPGQGRTQLAELVERLTKLHAVLGRARPRRPWVPELPTQIALDAVMSDPSVDFGRVVTVGLADEPARQRHRPATVDLEASGGLAVFGAGGSGRTTALRTCVASVVARAPVRDLQLVVFDFAGRSLKALLDLPHTRSVIAGDDVEGACREIEFLAAEVDRRRDILGEAKAESWSAVASHAERPPRLHVIIDGFAGLRSTLDSAAGHPWWDSLLRVVVDGRQVGIHALIAADRRNDLPAVLLGSVGTRLVLRMAEPEAMTTLGVPRLVARGADLPVGRGFLDGDEIQVAVLGDGDEAATGQSESAALTALATRCPDAPVDRIPGLPRIVRSLPPSLGGVCTSRVPVGVDERGAAVDIDLDGPVAVIGPHGSGRSNLLGVVADHLVSLAARQPVRLICIGDDRSPLASVADPPGIVVISDVEVAATTIADAEQQSETILLVDDAERFDVPPLAGAVGRWIEQRRPAVIAAERTSTARSLTGMLGALRRIQPLVIMQPEGAAEVEALAGRRVRFRPGTTFPVGRAVVVERRGMHLVQTMAVSKYHEKH